MERLVWISDLHWGLSTDEIDRTDEITSVAIQAAKYAVKVKARWFVFGGDIFHNNQPTEELIACFLRVLNILTKAGIRVFVMDGNHDKHSKAHRKSALQFLERLAPRYPNVKWIHDITTVRVFKGVVPCYFTFLPHIAKVHIPKEFKTPQDYVDAESDKIIAKMKFFGQHYVFSHLNVRGAVPGTEADMLKKSEIFLPDHFHTKSYLDKPYPTTINGHIHSSQKTGHVTIVGSPIFVSFGEKEKEKYFCEVLIPDGEKECTQVKLHPTKCRPFIELNVDLTTSIYNEAKLLKEIAKLPSSAIVKANITLGENMVHKVDMEKIRAALASTVFHVKPIVPKIVRKRIKRNARQTVKLNPLDAVRTFVGVNKPKDADAIVELASNYIEKVL